MKDKKGTLKAMAKALHGLGPGDKYRLLVVMAKVPVAVEGHADGFAVQPHSWPTQVTDKVIQVLEQLAAEGKLVGGQGTGSGGNGENVLGKTYRQAFGELDFGVRCQANLPYHRFGVSVICRMKSPAWGGL